MRTRAHCNLAIISILPIIRGDVANPAAHGEHCHSERFRVSYAHNLAMSISALTGIDFDEQDANLFLVDDARLRADALQHSVLHLKT